MDFKPILTYAGDGPLFRSLESNIASNVPHDTCEWKRSYGRQMKNVRVEASFQPFDVNILEKYKKGTWSVLQQPVLHIFVTECNDIEQYKSTVKDEIDTWLKTLHHYDITDWMVLLVETLDVRKTKNILPRTTVLDKIRLDFASKAGDRCISLLNPNKFEQRATESFRCLLQRLRHLMLVGYNKNITKYEELIRSNRERRNQENWSFINYFFLQEQLAFVLEMLGLHTEALVQYDELDAMFSQFILNSVFGEKQNWLKIFEKPIMSFHGITMQKKKMIKTREKIMDGSANLLEFRSYLFERQCILLKASNKIWEIAERLLGFLFSTIREIEALKIEMSDGSLACWEVICALEVLNLCDDVIETNDKYKCCQYSAPIWNLAKDKLFELGKLCGLLPGFTPTSEQLHMVVHLSTGIGDTLIDDEQDSDKKSHSPVRKYIQPPTERLKEALGSNLAFQKLYIELSELAISTYKHVSRHRSAKLVGLDLGNFYCTLDMPNKAINLFTDLLRELKAENWTYLASQTLLELANCYKKMDDLVSYTTTCSAISCCVDLETLVRTFYFDEFLKSLKILRKNMDMPYHFASFEDHFQVQAITILNKGSIIQDSFINVELKLESNFPREIIAEKIALSYETSTKSNNEKLNCDNKQMLPVFLHLDYKQDNNLSCASVVCDVKNNKNPVRRSSSTKRKVTPTVRSDFTNSVIAENISIKPGINIIELKSKGTRVGIWSFKQISLQIPTIDFLSESLPIKSTSFEVTTKPSSANLYFMNLVAGLEQNLKLNISAGSFVFPKESFITMKCSRNLRLKQIRNDEKENSKNDFQRELKIELFNLQSFEERIIELKGICELPGRSEEKHIEQKVSLQVPWSRNEIPIILNFLPALIASCRLHSSETQKFLQVVIKGVYDNKLILSNPSMKCASKGVILQNINPKSQNEIVIQKNLTVSYLWEIQVEPLKTENELHTIQIEFGMQFAEFDKPDIKRNYTSTFDVSDYTTLFKIHAKIEPSELCRVGSVCHMNLKIFKIHENPFTDLMYEVLTDQNTWAVCGRTAGVVSMMDSDQQQIMLEVLPLTAGFLPLPTIRLSKYISADKSKSEIHPKLHPFPPGQVYNATKSMQIHVLASSNTD